MGMNIVANWETDDINIDSTTVATKIAVLRGGESITIKSLAATTEFHYIGPKDRAEASVGFKLRGTDSMTLTLPISFGRNREIEIWAMATNANDNVTFFKLIDLDPETEAEEK